MRSSLHTGNIGLRRVVTNIDISEQFIKSQRVDSLLQSLTGEVTVVRQLRRISYSNDNTTTLFSSGYGLSKVGKIRSTLYNANKKDLKRNYSTVPEPVRKDRFKELSDKLKDWSVDGAATFLSTLVGFSAATLIPPIYTERKQKEVRRIIGAERMELELRNIAPPTREYKVFVERKEAINNLEKEFLVLEKESRIQEIIITGVQGSGKSELAEEYAQKYSERMLAMLPDNILTVKIFRVENELDFKRQYREFARELGIRTEDYDDKKLISKVHEELKHREHWLLVFDNLDNEKASESADYKFISNYIPASASQKGRVLITCRDLKVIPIDRRYSIGVIDVTSPAYRFSKEETNDLIDRMLGKDHREHNAGREWKERLGASLGYLPHAIKKAALYIAAQGETEGGEEKKIKTYTDEIRKELGLKDGEYPNVKIRYEEINKVINKKSIAAIDNNPLAKKILRFIQFLNPDFIQIELLRKRFRVGEKREESEFIEAIELLKRYALLEERSDNQWKLHRSVVKYFQEAEIDDRSSRLNKIIEFFRKNFKRDNTSQNVINNNALFIPHIENVITQREDIERSIESKYFRIAQASHYMMTGRSRKAREVLKKNIESIAKENLGTDDLQRFEDLNAEAKKNKGNIFYTQRMMRENENECFNLICKGLKEGNKGLLTIYAQTLYHLGRTYFDIGGSVSKYDQYLKQAVQVREIIDKELQQDSSNALKAAEEKYNDYYMDSILVERNGVLEFERKTKASVNEMEKIISKYDDLIKRKIEDKNKWSCRSEQFRTRQKIAVGKILYQEKKKECDKAVQEMYKDYIDKSEGSSITSEDVFNYLTEGNRKSDTRQAKYLNDMGRLLLIKEEYDQALRFYVTAVEIETDKGSRSLDLSEAYLKIAKIYIAKNNMDGGSAVLKKCIRIQEEIGIGKNHEQYREAIGVESGIVGSRSYAYRMEQELKSRDIYII
ncbi:ATP-binding protein [Candidatus Jidaibacter acanthamoebae]|nr:ATP-binding protein [Candidatus Jidaibacter acanthamoeba]